MKINFYKAIDENSGIYLHKSHKGYPPDIGEKVILFGNNYSVIKRVWNFTTSGDGDCADVFLKEENDEK